jgi:hypothetical protein
MGKYRRGNYVFVTRMADHHPRHVHIYRNEQLIARWDLTRNRPLSGEMNATILKLIKELQKEGKL